MKVSVRCVKQKILTSDDDIQLTCCKRYFRAPNNRRQIDLKVQVFKKSMSLLIEDGKKMKEKQVAKGTKRSVKDRHLRHQHFKKVLEDMSQIYVRQNTILSRKHQLGSYSQLRCGLSGYDSKRFIKSDGITTFAHGHYKTRMELEKLNGSTSI